MKVAILGCGSLGGVMAARLSGQQDLELTVINRNPLISEAIRQSGLILREGSRTRICSVRLVEQAEGGPFDALILATKSNGLVQAVQGLLPHLAEKAFVVTAQNGLVALDLAEVIDEKSFLIPGCVLWGASMDGPGVYRITASRPFIIGALGARTRDPALTAAEKLLSRIFPVEISPNIRGVLWSKLAFSSTFTALGGITGLKFGKLAGSRKTREIMLRMGGEVLEVAQAEGITLEQLSPGLNIERFLSEQGYSRFLKHLILRIVTLRDRNTESSMLDSIRRGRKTEIEFINGKLVQIADRRGVAVPYNRLVVNLIGEMERGRLQAKRENLAAFRSLG